MSHIHVCLVSEQTVPNILGIHHFRPDQVLFITTSKMKELNKARHILATLSMLGMDYEKRFYEIEVAEDSLLDCRKKLDEWIKGREDADFTVNFTGGTKIMSIAAYEFFKDYGGRMIYIPLGKNHYLIPFPKKASNTLEPLSLRLKVTDYLAAYGLKVTNLRKLPENHEEALRCKDFAAWIVRNYKEIKPLLERFSDNLRKHRDDSRGYAWKTAYMPQSDAEKELFVRAGFSNEGGAYFKHLNRREIDFLTGGWLEVFCYTELLKFKGQGIDDVVLGIMPETAQGRNNEFDVMFTKDNALYTVECKSLDQKDDPKADALYKIAALQKEFGLRVESFLVSTSPHILRDGKLKPAIEARAEQFRTTVIAPSEVLHFADRAAQKLGLR